MKGHNSMYWNQRYNLAISRFQQFESIDLVPEQVGCVCTKKLALNGAFQIIDKTDNQLRLLLHCAITPLFLCLMNMDTTFVSSVDIGSVKLLTVHFHQTYTLFLYLSNFLLANRPDSINR